MTADANREGLDDTFARVRDLDASLGEQLHAFAEEVRQRRPEFSAAVDRLVERLRQSGAGDAAPREGEPMPPFVLPDEAGRLVSLHMLDDVALAVLSTLQAIAFAYWRSSRDD